MSDERREALGSILKQILEPIVESISQMKQDTADVKDQLKRIEAQQSLLLESIQGLVKTEKKR